MAFRFLPVNTRPPILRPGDVVNTPLLREAIVLGEINRRWHLRYTDDHTEVVLQAKLLALVRRGAGDCDALLAAAAKVISLRARDGAQ